VHQHRTNSSIPWRSGLSVAAPVTPGWRRAASFLPTRSLFESETDDYRPKVHCPNGQDRAAFGSASSIRVLFCSPNSSVSCPITASALQRLLAQGWTGTMPPYPVVVNVVKLRQKTLLASEPSSPNSIPLNAPSIDKPKNVNTQQIRLNQQIGRLTRSESAIMRIAVLPVEIAMTASRMVIAPA